MDSDRNDDFDETLSSSQDDEIVHRSAPLQEDINTGFFDVLLQPSKRTTKNKMLKEEIFTFDVYVVKQCGFLTSRPLFWLRKMDEYVSTTENTSGIFRYKKIKNSEKCLSALIDISYQTTRKVSVVINFQAGVVMVKGEQYKHWIESESQAILPSIFQTTEVVHEKHNGEETDDVERQLDSLWHESEANKLSIENIDETVRGLRIEVSNYLAAYESAVLDVGNIYSEINKTDSRTSTFMETTTDTCKKLIESHVAKIHKRIDTMSDKFDELKTSVNQRIDNFIEKHNSVNENVIRIQELTNELENQKKEISNVIDGYKTFQQNTKEESISSHHPSQRKISFISKELEKHQSLVSGIEHQLQELKKSNTIFKDDVTKTLMGSSDATTRALDEVEKELEGKIRQVEERLVNRPPNLTETEQKITKMQEQLQQIGSTPRTRTATKHYDVIFSMDSNSKFIRFKKFWTLNNSLRRRIYTQTQLKTFIENLTLNL